MRKPICWIWCVRFLVAVVCANDQNQAFGLTETFVVILQLALVLSWQSRSRLGCQVKLTKEMDGMVVKLPSATRNVR